MTDMIQAMAEMARAENKASKDAWKRVVSSEFRKRLRSVASDRIRAQAVMDTCCEVCGVTIAELTGEARHRSIARIRQECMTEMHRQGLSVRTIGHVFNRDHTTVLHAIKASNRRAKETTS